VVLVEEGGLDVKEESIYIGTEIELDANVGKSQS